MKEYKDDTFKVRSYGTGWEIVAIAGDERFAHPLKAEIREYLRDKGFYRWYELYQALPELAEGRVSAQEAYYSEAYYSAKADKGKVRWSLVPWKGMAAVLDVLEFGAEKYGPDSWRTVPDARDRYREAVGRHAVAVLADGALAKDEESGRYHLAHLACNCLFLLALGE